jgi:hypothetical protein
MKYNNKIRLILLIFFLLFITSCKTIINLSNEKEAVQQIEEDIKSKKIVFLGDQHDWAFPPQFIADNLERFYKAGVRYIFLEEKSGYYLKKPEQYDSFVYPAWGTWGYKQEYHVLTDEITRLNKIYVADPLIVIWPEENATFTEEDYSDTHLEMNKRDITAQKVIIDLMDNTDKKGLIFYGSAHGLKKPTIWNSSSKVPYWTMIGVYLNKHYGDDFSTFRFGSFNTNKNFKVIYGNDDACKVITGENLNLLLKLDNLENEFDHYCLYPTYTMAVPEFYIPEERNIKYLLSLFKDTKIANDKKIDVWSKKSEQLLAIYYLKYHLGDKFDFDWNKSEEDLYTVLEKITDEDLQNLQYDLKNMENYISYLFSFISNYLYHYQESESKTWVLKDTEVLIRNMSYAQNLDSHDIWPQYWTAYLQTDKAIVSGNQKDYKNALISWEQLLENDMFYASPIIKLAYEKAALCSEKNGDLESSAIYQCKSNNVNYLLDFDFESYFYFGW